MTQAKPTGGEWVEKKARTLIHIAGNGGDTPVCSISISPPRIPEIEMRNRVVSEAHANAALIIEAGTVHHETGLTPRQLAERVKRLEGVLQTAKGGVQLLYAEAMQTTKHRVLIADTGTNTLRAIDTALAEGGGE